VKFSELQKLSDLDLEFDLGSGRKTRSTHTLN